MALKIKGKAATKGYQGVQGMSKSSGKVIGSGGVNNNGVAAKSVSGTMKAKSSKKKVIVNALLTAMKAGHMSKQLGNGGNMNASSVK